MRLGRLIDMRIREDERLMATVDRILGGVRSYDPIEITIDGQRIEGVEVCELTYSRDARGQRSPSADGRRRSACRG